MRTAAPRTPSARMILPTFAVMCLALALAAPVTAQPAATYPSPEKAVEVLVAAIRADDISALNGIFGGDGASIVESGDPVQDANDRAKFVELHDQMHRIDKGKKSATLVVGDAEWPFPIPIVKVKGGWSFDATAGREEILNRRIGMNELTTIQVLLEIVDAQRAYASVDWDDDGLLEYSAQFRSDIGRHNGLFWPTAEGEAPSPLGLLVDVARGEGYTRPSSNYHGYQFRLLTAQGPDAPGGARDYMVRDSLIGGFAVLAWPASWGESGVMSFLVGFDGVVYQKDLGETTTDEAAKIEAYNSDSSWMQVSEEDLAPLGE